MNRFAVVFFSLVLGLFATTARADDAMMTQGLVKAINLASQTQTVENKQLTDAMTKALGLVGDKITNAILQQDTNEQEEAVGLMDGDTASTLTTRMDAAAATEVYKRDIMTTRSKQFSGVVVGTDDNHMLVDIARSPPMKVNDQQFSIAMRFFCDPLARVGTMKDVEVETQEGVVKCGDGTYTGSSPLSGKPLADRKKFGSLDTSDEARAIINLPINPARLFLETTTYPARPDPSKPAGSQTNVNPLAQLYFAAIMQSIELLVGNPPDKNQFADFGTPSGQEQYLRYEASKTRKSVASYIFAQLAAERMQSSDNGFARVLAQMSERFASGAMNDPGGIMAERIKKLRSQPGVSMAEYLNILMYEIPVSPGYLELINNPSNMPPEKLAREKLKLMGLQTAVNYQRNRWMEMLTALEATNDGSK